MQAVQLDMLRAIQGIASPLLDGVMMLVTQLGEKMLLAGIFCLVYWCWDKRAGQTLLCALLLSISTNNAIKDVVKAPRPFLQPGIENKLAYSATGHSFPSGHTQNAATFWVTSGWLLRRRGWLTLGGVIAVLVAFSRMVLGVHYPIDVIGGLALGVGCSVVAYRLLERRCWNVMLILLAVMAIVLGITAESADSFKSLGLLAGAVLGILLEEKYVGFETRGISMKSRVVRYLGGMAVLGVLYLVPKLFLPEHPAVWMMRYGVTGFFAVGVWPLLFVRWKL